MKKIIVLLLIIIGEKVIGQSTYQSNLWNSVLMNYTTKNFRVNSEIGLRMHDHFVRSYRTALGRIVAERRLDSTHGIGLGYAYFEHFNKTSVGENRFFLQYSVALRLKQLRFNFRFRNENRFFENRITTNRSRLQIQIRPSKEKKFQPQGSAEGFFTPGKNALAEQRYAVGILIRANQKFSILAYYMGQFQSNNPYLQHILGWQAQLNLN